MPLNPDRFMTAIFKNSPDPIVVADTDRKIIAVNQAFVQQFGYGENEALGRTTAFLYADEKIYRDQGARHFNKAANTGWSRTEVRYRRKDGSVFPSETVASQITADDGAVVGYLGIIHDISETVERFDALKTVNKRLSEEGASFHALYSRTPAIMHSISRSGEIDDVSDAWLNAFGYSRHEVMGRKVTDFLTPECEAWAINEALPRLWERGHCDKVPFQFVTKDGQVRDIEVSAVLDRSMGEPRTLSVLVDVTDRNEAQHQLEKANHALRQFSAIVSHDLQGPLRHIAMFTSMLETKLAGNVEVAADMERITGSIARMQRMIRSLLDYSSITDRPVSYEHVETDALVRAVIAESAGMEAGVEANIVCEPLPDVTGDPELLGHVFANLIGNAKKYSRDGRVNIRVSAERRGHFVTFRVSDDGIGIAPEFAERIFLVFKRLHRDETAFKGAGVGLSLCKSIVESHGGEIWLDTNYHGGSRFCFTLPAAQVSEPQLEISNAL